jgi:hypothetical protein
MVPITAGIITDFPERIIPENKASDCKNILFEQGRFKTRWGYTSVGSQLYDSNPSDGGGITAIIDFITLASGTRHIVALTTSDAYEYDQNTGTWGLITKNYNTGKVTVSATGGVALTATGGTWTATSLSTGNMEIMLGTTDMTATSPGTLYGATGDGLNTDWWTVKSLDSATGLSLTTATGTAVATAVAYVIRECWSGDADNRHSYAFPYDTAASDKVLIVTNGIEEAMRWTGTGHFDWMDVDADISKQVDYFGSVGFEHLILSNTIESGTNYPQRLKHTSAGRINTWATRNNFYDLLNDDGEIKGLQDLRGRIYVYKSNSITELWADPAGDNDDPFNFVQNKINFVGTPSIDTVVNTGNFHIFFGSDNNIYIYDGVNLTNVGEEVSREIDSNIDRAYIGRSFAALLKEENLYCLFIPTKSEGSGFPAIGYVLNYVERTWTKWEFAHNITAFGKYEKQTTILWSDWTATTNSWSSKTMRWSDLFTNENKDRYLIGDSDGYVYEFEGRHLTDNGTAIETQLVTRDFPLNDMKHTSRILELEVGFDKITDIFTATAIASEISIECSPDFGKNWSTAATGVENWTGISGDYNDQVFNFVERGKACRFRITSNNGTPYDLEVLKIGFNPSSGKVR